MGVDIKGGGIRVLWKREKTHEKCSFMLVTKLTDRGDNLTLEEFPSLM